MQKAVLIQFRLDTQSSLDTHIMPRPIQPLYYMDLQEHGYCCILSLGRPDVRGSHMLEENGEKLYHVYPKYWDTPKIK